MAKIRNTFWVILRLFIVVFKVLVQKNTKKSVPKANSFFLKYVGVKTSRIFMLISMLIQI